MTRSMLISSYLLLMATTVLGQENYMGLRKQMVNTQILSRGIDDPVTLKALLTVPRHEFVPEAMKPYAYADNPLPIGDGQTISQPFMVAYMTQILRLKPGHKVLEIGTGSGYQAAVLSVIVDTVHTIEIVKNLSNKAKKRLNGLGYTNVKVQWGDGYNGWPSEAPFDAIIVTAGAETVPQPLVDQLKVGGRMVIPVGPHGGIRSLQLIVKKKNKIVTRELMPVRFVPFTRNESGIPD